MPEEGAVRITVRVQPNAKRSQVVRYDDGVLRLKIAAPAVDGKANRELVRILSELLGVPRLAVTIERGLTGRQKVVRVQGVSEGEIRERVGENSEEDTDR